MTSVVKRTAAGFLVVVAVGLTVAAGMPASAATRYAAIVADAHTGRILHAENADSRRYPASLTKMMTLYLTFEALDSGRFDLDDPLAVSSRAAGQPPSKVGLAPGETISLYDAIMILATKSANDIAVVVAEAIGGTEWQFARLMTEKARALGMRNTTFRNASGLPHSEQVTTARDMLKLSMALYENFPHYVHVFESEAYRYRGRRYRNHNRLLGRYDGMIGIKTGYIHASGFNLAAAVQRQNHKVFAVVFGGRTAQSRDARMAELLDEAFETLKRASVQLVMMNPPKWKPGLGRRIDLSTSDAIAGEIATEAQGSNDGEGEWGIQVGAFSKETAARRALALASDRLPEVFDGTRPAIVEHEDKFGKLYRARRIGLTEADARDACAILQSLRLACVVAPPTESQL